MPTAALKTFLEKGKDKAQNPRVPVTALHRGREVDLQVAAPAETRTPNLHRARIAHRRVRMEGWRQWRLGGERILPNQKTKEPT
jgi:hypothetical protein